jgi:redox-sensitive bicupin YhaK (pirin superfamily)
LATGHGDSHVSCLHLAPGASIPEPSLTHAAALLIVHGKVTVAMTAPTSKIDIHAGMGCVFEQEEPYSISSEAGAIVIIIESEQLVTNRRGISTPERIAGQRWPGDVTVSA